MLSRITLIHRVVLVPVLLYFSVKGAFSRAETDRLSDKKDHVTAFVAELYSDNFYTWKGVEVTELKLEATELRSKFRVYWHFNIISVKLLYCTGPIIFKKSLFLCIVSRHLTSWARIMELSGNSNRNCWIIS